MSKIQRCKHDALHAVARKLVIYWSGIDDPELIGLDVEIVARKLASKVSHARR